MNLVFLVEHCYELEEEDVMLRLFLVPDIVITYCRVLNQFIVILEVFPYVY